MNILKQWRITYVVLTGIFFLIIQDASCRSVFSAKQKAKHGGGKKYAVYNKKENRENQSPINLSPAFAMKTNLKDIDFNYDKVTNLHVEVGGKPLRKKGKKVFLRVAGDNFIIVDGNRYRLEQIHVKTPSEHVFKWKHYPVEMQFVHQGEKGGYVVLSVCLRTHKHKKAAEHTEWNKIVTALSGGTPYVHNIELTKLLPQRSSYYRYEGSLTTKPYSPALWFVYVNPITMPIEQVWDIEEAIGGRNNRPVQLPGKKRAVYLDTSLDR